MAALVFFATGCGKKGPPLTPFVLIPEAPAVAIRGRVGGDLYVDVTVPAANLDGSKPAVVSHVELYGVTALNPPSRARFLEIATLVATIPVAPAGSPGDTVATAPDLNVGAIQGKPVTIRDTLTADELQPRTLAVTVEEARQAARPALSAVVAPVAPGYLRRFYMAIAYGGRNRPGPPSVLGEVPLTVLPVSPRHLEVTLTDAAVVLQWEPADGLLGWLFDRPLPDEADPVPVARPATALAAVPPAPPLDWLPGPTTYRVYRETSPDPLAMPPARNAASSWLLTAPQPINPVALGALTFTDPVVFDDRERCYSVRTIRGSVESDPSPRRCVRMIDTVAPVTPTGLASIVANGVVNLIWEPNVEEDLRGYIVLRRDPGSATLLQLTPTPISETRYSDRAVMSGVQYTYEVRAVDNRIPVPNVSEPAEVTETAR